MIIRRSSTGYSIRLTVSGLNATQENKPYTSYYVVQLYDTTLTYRTLYSMQYYTIMYISLIVGTIFNSLVARTPVTVVRGPNAAD